MLLDPFGDFSVFNVGIFYDQLLIHYSNNIVKEPNIINNGFATVEIC